MVEVEWTPVRVQTVINTPFRVLVLFVVAILVVIIVINAS